VLSSLSGRNNHPFGQNLTVRTLKFIVDQLGTIGDLPGFIDFLLKTVDSRFIDE